MTRAKRRKLVVPAVVACGASVACSVDSREPETFARAGASGAGQGGDASGRADGGSPVPEGSGVDGREDRSGEACSAPGAARCVDAESTQHCRSDGAWGDPEPCLGATPSCRAALDGDCGCIEGQRRCVAEAPEACINGAFRGQPACVSPTPHCLARTGVCVSCEPGSETCQDGTALRCSSEGAFESLEARVGETVTCGRRAPGESCVDDLDCTSEICLDSGTCGCEDGSCADGLACSGETGLCVSPLPDCPAVAPLPAGETDLAIVRVRFDASGDAEVQLQNVGAGLLSFAPLGYLLCNGANNCVYLSEEQPVTLLLNDSFRVVIPETGPAGGELAVILQVDENIFAESYVAWGSGAGADTLEVVANATLARWASGQRIPIESGDTGFVCVGATDVASGYASCRP